jgi:hypothetical protein
VTEPQILTLNERVKGFSNFLFNLAAALIAATGARLWARVDVDLTVVAWLGGATALLLLASGVLYLLEPGMEEIA